MKDYLTIRETKQCETEISRSVFIARAYPSESEENALSALDSVRKEHYKATHHCYAYVIGADNKTVKFSDDGEPSGTAGRPILSMIEQYGLTNILLVVIRYFGGIKLGAGGLTRAYRNAAASVLKESPFVQCRVCDLVRFQTDYNFYGKLNAYFEEHNIVLQNTVFAESVRIDVCIPIAQTKTVCDEITDLSNGTCIGTVLERTYLDIPMEKQTI